VNIIFGKHDEFLAVHSSSGIKFDPINTRVHKGLGLNLHHASILEDVLWKVVFELTINNIQYGMFFSFTALKFYTRPIRAFEKDGLSIRNS
jgi:hypothetical protein